MMTAAAKLVLLQKHSLTSVLEREIEAMILRGAMPVGERINELQLAETFGTSRSPVREALRALEAAGLVEAVPNRGIFIRRVDKAFALEVYGVRAALFGYAGQLLATDGSADDHAELLSRHAAMGEAAAAHRFEAYLPLNFDFHDFIVAASGNTVLAAQYRALVKQLRLFRARNLMSGDTLAVSHREHQTIVDAVVARDGPGAYRACFDHVEMGRQRVIAQSTDESSAAASVEETKSA
ncbi:GntR family transcriptional regulator [Aureimonas sp. SA4125]|uniref:FCD domain-containing protein n=1 Tax=Aureimonas sp. SA4125 TaxID=2826993 RepID=UPI001CC8022B|nr:FCD domain-containing protein [Aureimonas sp. SA4125]BDA83355.1 GntR family transcriptional regulator [Aureimonas sp. SA4125]